jgi:hypothetical protein
VPVGHKEKAFEFMLEFNPVFQHTVVVAKVKLAGRTHAGQNPLLGIYRTQSTNSLFGIGTAIIVQATRHYK